MRNCAWTARNIMMRELLGTTMLAGLVLSSGGALAQNVPATTAGGPVNLPTIDVEGKDGGLGGRFTGYTVNLEKPVAASKTNIPLIQTPTAIQVVPREVMDDQQAIGVKEAVANNVSSVVVGGTNFHDNFIIRGFNVGNRLYRNDLQLRFTTNIETANLQSIEVLKGPAAMLFGRIEPGGLVNLVPKRPLLVPYFSVQEQFGSWDLTRTTVDATGPLTADNSLAYRVNLAYLNTGSFRDFVTRENFFIAPTITYHPIEQFRLNIDGEYQNLSFVDEGFGTFPAIGRRPANIPISRYLADPAVTVNYPNRQERGFIGYDWTFDIADNWSLTNRFGYTTQSFRDSEAGLSELDPVTGIATRDLYFVLGSRYVVAANLDLKGTIDTGPLHHSVLLGTDYFSFNRFDKGFCCTSPLVGPINIFNPVYNGVGLGQFTYDMNNYFERDREAWKGIYAQDQISFADDRLHILIGGRYDWANFGTGFSRTSLAAADAAFVHQNDSAFSPRVGAVVQPLPWLSFYGNYSQSFGTAGTGFPSPGEPPFPPQLGIQYEGGAKAELLDGRLSMTVAYYDITKTNILAQAPGSRFSVPIGEARSKGVEFDIAGRINENWSLIGSYSHTDARVTRDSTETGGAGNTGNRLASVPLNAGNLWVKYDADGALQGLSLGGGLNVVGQRQGDLANTFQLPAYTLVNAMIMYRFQPAFAPWVKNLTAQLNITNLLDVTYFQASSGRTTITSGVPRTFLASVRAEF